MSPLLNSNSAVDIAMELLPEIYVVEMEPTSNPRAPIGKKRIWFDARTLYPITMISFDR